MRKRSPHSEERQCLADFEQAVPGYRSFLLVDRLSSEVKSRTILVLCRGRSSFGYRRAVCSLRPRDRSRDAGAGDACGGRR